MVFKTVSGGASGFYKQGPVEPEELGSTNFSQACWRDIFGTEKGMPTYK